MARPDSTASDRPHRRPTTSNGQPGLSTALARFSHTLSQLRRDDLSDAECAALRALQTELLRLGKPDRRR
ncbi:MAG TPA: hypothetical protein VGE94_17070 [Chloroflexota bacterium]